MRSNICRGKNLEKGGEFMRKTFGKRMISVCVACLLMVSTISFVAYADEAVPFYNNVYSVSSTASISSSGLLTVTNSYTGSSSVTTKAVITTYVERKTLGIFWSRVDIGQTNDEWVDTIYNYSYTGSHSHQLSKTGTYRVTVEYVIYGSGGSADTITKEIQKTY